MTAYVVAPAAKADVEEMALYIAAADRAAAERFIDEVYDAFDLLAEHPGLGHHRRDLTDRPVRFWSELTLFALKGALLHQVVRFIATVPRSLSANVKS